MIAPDSYHKARRYDNEANKLAMDRCFGAWLAV